MKSNISPTLRNILKDTERETKLARDKRSIKRLRQMIKHAPAVLPFGDRLRSGMPCLIAEIKERSPSQSKMLTKNVLAAPTAYRDSGIVRAISVLTNKTHFGSGMTVERMLNIKEHCNKPVLRKDFITEAYQVYEARAFGADAILLMANILEPSQMRDLSDLAFELGMDVLFETHKSDELDDLPNAADIIGINSRNFNGSYAFKLARIWRKYLWGTHDVSTNQSRLNYVSQIPERAVKIAESGVTPANCLDVFARGFHAALVGTSLLLDSRGIEAALADFETAIASVKAELKSAAKAPQLA